MRGEPVYMNFSRYKFLVGIISSFYRYHDYFIIVVLSLLFNYLKVKDFPCVSHCNFRGSTDLVAWCDQFIKENILRILATSVLVRF